ncbi:MAG: hypothetical protein ACXABK_03000 [Candidatus Heimdallarchaeaceae archaeon]
MSNLVLSCSLCKDCGHCCYSCEFLDYSIGCTNDEYRLSSRCAAFPLLFGVPEKMGHKNFWVDDSF